jgi:hypothetical protein
LHQCRRRISNRMVRYGLYWNAILRQWSQRSPGLRVQRDLDPRRLVQALQRDCPSADERSGRKRRVRLWVLQHRPQHRPGGGASRRRPRAAFNLPAPLQFLPP